MSFESPVSLWNFNQRSFHNLFIQNLQAAVCYLKLNLKFKNYTTTITMINVKLITSACWINDKLAFKSLEKWLERGSIKLLHPSHKLWPSGYCVAVLHNDPSKCVGAITTWPVSSSPWIHNNNEIYCYHCCFFCHRNTYMEPHNTF